MNHQFRQGYERSDKEVIAQTRVNDANFIEAMRKAISKGKENPRIGTFKDDSPLLPAHFSREFNRSCCSSSAGMCAELGEIE